MAARLTQTASGFLPDGLSAPTSLEVDLPDALTPGRIEVCFVGFFFSRILDVISSDGNPWSEVHGFQPVGGELRVSVFAREVQPGDASDVTISENATGSLIALVGEIADCKSDPATWVFSDVGAVNTTRTLSDTVALAEPSFAVVFGAADSGTTTGVTAITPAGYAQDQLQIPTLTDAPAGSRTGILGHSNDRHLSRTFSTSWDGDLRQYAQIVLALTPSGAGPPLRQFPRDDALGHTPRPRRESSSVQATVRQGWQGTYR